MQAIKATINTKYETFDKINGIISMSFTARNRQSKAQHNQCSTSDSIINHLVTAIILPIQNLWAADIAEIDKSCRYVSVKNFDPVYVSNDSFTKVDVGEIVGQHGWKYNLFSRSNSKDGVSKRMFFLFAPGRVKSNAAFSKCEWSYTEICVP